MKNIVIFAVILLALTACTAHRIQPATEPVAADTPQAGRPNRASVYCTQQANKLEIHTAADGSQYGTCVAPDGSACDEWAYYRGECSLPAMQSATPAMPTETAADAGGSTRPENSGGYMPPATSEQIADWRGVIKGTPPGAQYDDYFERQDLEQVIYFGIDSMDPAVQSQIVALRDSGRIVHLYGTLLSNVPDYNGSQIQVDRIEVEE